MDTVNVAELKERLSSLLNRVQAGEEFVIRDHNLPIAKIVPLRSDETDLEEASLVASGQMTLPKRKLEPRDFWAIGAQVKTGRKVTVAIEQAIAADREEYAGVLGHKRDHSPLRARAKRNIG